MAALAALAALAAVAALLKTSLTYLSPFTEPIEQQMAGTEVDLLDSCRIARQGSHLERLNKFKRSFGKGGGIMMYHDVSAESSRARLDQHSTQLVHNRATETSREQNPWGCQAYVPLRLGKCC